jgi:tetratricopeptide (TPR) repeat protein
VIALGIAAYSNVSSVPLLYDDHPALERNESIRGLSLRALTPPRETTLAGRPLANLSFALNHAAAGLSLAPLHWTNVAIHLMAALLLMALVRRTLLLPRFHLEESAAGIAFAVALLWMLHPVQTESITYLVQRVESLAALFLLLTLYAGLRAAQATRPFGWSALAVMACGLGMACKETMAVAPVIVILYDRAFLFRSFRQAVPRRGALYGCLAATWAIVALQVATLPRPFSTGFHFAGLAPHRYLGIEAGAVLRYFRVLVWPAGLIFDYGDAGTAVPVPGSLAEWGPPAALVAALIGLSVWAWSKNSAIGFLATGFFILLLPSSIIPVKSEPIAEHRLYLPSAAVLLLLAFAARPLRKAQAIAAACAVLVLGVLTWQRNRVYGSAISLWEDTARKRPQNARAWSALGQAYIDGGEIGRARAVLATALERDPSLVTALDRLGILEEQAGHPEAAARYYRRSLESEPRQPDILLNLADCLSRLGRNDEALAAYQSALRLGPGQALGHYNFGVFLVRLRRYQAALDEFHLSTRLDPKLAAGWHRAGVVASWLGRPEAVPDLEASLRLEPRLEAMEDLAWLLATHPDPAVRNGERALFWAARANALGKDVRTLEALAAAQAETSQFEAARQTETKAIEASPTAADLDRLRRRLALYASGKPYRERPEPRR